MRETKYRIWDKKNKIMEYGIDLFSAYTDESGFKWISGNMGVTFSEDEKDNLIFLQYTGLKDKNGKEIYEGDTLRCGINDEGNVEFSNGCFYVLGIMEYPTLAWVCSFGCEVIGNIWENKELIKND